jgi:hypothetical protein
MVPYTVPTTTAQTEGADVGTEMATTEVAGKVPARSVVGRSAASFTMPIELGKVREFARATRSHDRDHMGVPGDKPIIPGTFLATAALWHLPASSPWTGVDRDVQRLLHGEETYIFHGPPPRAGDVLVGTARIDKVYEKAGKRGGTMSFAETVTEFRDVEGRLVAEARTTTIETSRPATE